MYGKTAFSLRDRLRANRFLYFLCGCFRKIVHSGKLFAHSIGYALGDKTSQEAMPIPPPRLRHRVHGDLCRTSFLAAGSQVYWDVAKIMEAQGIKCSEKLKILDFGCGCARVLGYFFHHGKKGVFTGTDIDADAIAWNRTNYPALARWDTNDSMPPLPYPDEAFDVVFAISIFTHMDEKLQFDWLRELHRILAATGVLICSVHGNPVWQQASIFTRKLQTAMSKRGFFFLESNKGLRNLAGLPKFYQTSFHSEEYVRRRWGEHFQIIDYSDQAIGNHQTAVVLRKKDLA